GAGDEIRANSGAARSARDAAAVLRQRKTTEPKKEERSMRRFIPRIGVLVWGMAIAAGVWAQAPEKKKITIAVGGKALFYYLPLTVAERKGYFKDEGLEVEIPDFPGGARALQALGGGSAHSVSGD